MPELETKRLRLRKLAISDSAFIVTLLNDPSFIKNITDRGVRTTQDAEQYLLRGPLHSYAEHGFGLLLVEELSSGLPLGMCGLIKRSNLEHVDIGFAYLPQFWGKGFAFEAAEAVVGQAKAKFYLKKLLGVTNPDNEGSIRILRKLGMKEEGTVILHGETNEILLFARDL